MLESFGGESLDSPPEFWVDGFGDDVEDFEGLAGVAAEFLGRAGDAGFAEVADAVAELDGLGFGGHGADFFEEEAVTEGVDFFVGEAGLFFGGGFDAGEFLDETGDTRAEEGLDFGGGGGGFFEGVVEEGDAVELFVGDAASVDEGVEDIEGVGDVGDGDLSVAVLAVMAFGGEEGGAVDEAHCEC